MHRILLVLVSPLSLQYFGNCCFAIATVVAAVAAAVVVIIIQRARLNKKNI